MTAARLSRTSSRSRGRPRGFDPASTLLRIRACFAGRGYAGTTLDELANATGLARPSLYNAFGDKRAMFLRALESEYEEVCVRLSKLDESEPLITRIARFFEAATAGYVAGTSNQTLGIAFGAALAETATDPDVRLWLRRFDAAFRRVARGMLSKDASAPDAMLLSVLAVALCVRARAIPLSDDIDLPAVAALLAARTV